MTRQIKDVDLISENIQLCDDAAACIYDASLIFHSGGIRTVGGHV